MAQPHVITALVSKRAQLADEIEDTHNKLRQMVLDLENPGAKLKLFNDQMQAMLDPDYYRSFAPASSRLIALHEPGLKPVMF